MELFLYLIELLVAVGVGINLVAFYFQINKIWQRKHEKPVAESVSVMALLLGIVTSIPFLIKFAVIDKIFILALDIVVALIVSAVLLLIGAGVWIKENQGVGFLTLLKRAIVLERSEASYLIKDMLRPRNAEEILDILQKVASIDQEISRQEIKLIKQFAEQWKLPLPDMKPGNTDNTNLVDLRASVSKYLEMSPPPEQAQQLGDMIQFMIKADNKVTHEEKLIQQELSGIINAYANAEGLARTVFDVLLVPQNEKQIDSVNTLFPGIKPRDLRGASVYSVGEFYSEEYAEEICKKYIELGIFTTVLEH